MVNCKLFTSMGIHFSSGHAISFYRDAIGLYKYALYVLFLNIGLQSRVYQCRKFNRMLTIGKQILQWFDGTIPTVRGRGVNFDRDGP